MNPKPTASAFAGASRPDSSPIEAVLLTCQRRLRLRRKTVFSSLIHSFFRHDFAVQRLALKARFVFSHFIPVVT